jgi:hypothetical protein
MHTKNKKMMTMLLFFSLATWTLAQPSYTKTCVDVPTLGIAPLCLGLTIDSCAQRFSVNITYGPQVVSVNTVSGYVEHVLHISFLLVYLYHSS